MRAESSGLTEQFGPYEVLPQPVWCSDQEGHCLYSNRAMTLTTGLSPEAMLGDGYLQGVHPDDCNRVRDVLPAHWMAQDPVEYEYRLLQATGEYHWVCSRSQPVRSETGELIHWVSTCHDIDALKRAEHSRARQNGLSVRLLRLTQGLARATDLQTAVASALQGCHEVLQAHGVLLYLLSDNGNELLLSATHGYSDEDVTSIRSVAATADLPAAQAIRVERPIWVEADLAERYPQMHPIIDTYHLQALACIPLMRARRPMGVLVLDFTEPQPFDPDLRALLVGAADEIGQALVRTGLLTVRQRLEQYQVLLNTITDQLSRSLTCEEVHRGVLQESAEVTGAYGGFFTSVALDGATLVVDTQQGYAPQFMERHHVIPPEADLPVQLARRTGQAVYVSSRAELLQRFPELAGTLEARTQALAVLPLRSDGQVTGTLALSYASPHDFDPVERQFLVALATHTSQVLQRARLYEREQAARRQAEEVARSEQLNQQSLRGILNALPNLVWILTPDGLVQEFNTQWGSYTGQTEQMEGVSWLEAIHPADQPLLMQIRAEAIRAVREYRLELRIRRSDHTYRWHVARVIPVLVDGQLMRWVGSATDIDDQKRTEELLEQRVMERTRRWQDLNLELRAIATTLAGSLEEPLRRVFGVVGLIEQRLGRLDHLKDERIVQLFRLLSAETQRMSGVAQEIRQFSDLENRELRLSRVPLDQLVIQVRSDLESYTRQQTVKWKMGSLPVVRADALLLRQVFAEVFLTLLSRPADTGDLIITISAAVHGQQVEVRLESNGRFTAEEVQLLFSPLGHDLESGGGAGLANVRRTVARHGGQISTVESEAGTVLALTLPLWRDPPVSRA
ncbi:PAS domain-containing protein [Deinococcus sonorensis]|uniref:histidine kinase n=2 Tax=Deinococcus sonorensis TaxID=309891 RepID=A0AAU7UEH3_9DEIO